MKFLPGNSIRLLVNGADYFPALIAAIDEARLEVRLETYIFADDITGRAVASALARAAQRGVAVHVLVDGFGAAGFMTAFGRTLQSAGVDVRIYRPEISRFKLRRHRLRRLHRKLATIDARVAFVGGINIIDDMDTPHQTPPRHDYAVCIEGPLLAPIHAAMHHLWLLVDWASLRRRFRKAPALTPVINQCGDVRATFAIRDNLHHRRDIEDAYLEAILTAREEIVIACAYFLPGRRFRLALMDAARRGVRVILLLQGRVEYALLHYATQALYDVLLGAGIHIHEYRKGFLHAKVAVVDSRWATVGSSNIDPFSLLLAREANVIVKHDGFAATLRAQLQQTMDSGAGEIVDRHWRSQWWPRRMLSALAYSLVRLMIGLAGYGSKH